MRYVIPERNRETRVLVLSDLHLPYVDRTAVRLALRIAADYEPHYVVLNGDIVDFYGVSRYNVPPLRRTAFAEEIEYAREFLEWLREKLGKARVVYLEGNHELRLRLYLWRRAHELSELDDLRLPSLLRLSRLEMEYLEAPHELQPASSPAMPVVQAGTLYITHGHTVRMSGDVVNVARTLFHKTLVNMLVGHWHRVQHHEETTYDGRTLGAWVCGCLCMPRPHYDFGRIWGQGIALVTLRGRWFRPELVSFFRREGQMHAFALGKHYKLKDAE